MKIIFFKRQGMKHGWLSRLLITICLLCSTSISYLVLNQPTAGWQEAGFWQVKVYQKADQIMSPAPPWMLIYELNMKLTRQGSGNAPWCLEVSDAGGGELLPGITRLFIYYGEDLAMVDGYGVNAENEKVMGLREFFSLSLCGEEFFSLQRKRYQHLLMLVRDEVKVVLDEKRGKKAWWEKEHPWWVYFESDEPKLKAKLQ